MIKGRKGTIIDDAAHPVHMYAVKRSIRSVAYSLNFNYLRLTTMRFILSPIFFNFRGTGRSPRLKPYASYTNIEY